MIEVIALDLEGTLISNAVSQIPRPGLYKFLELCRSITNRVVIFTSVREEVFRSIAKELVKEGYAPKWFAEMEYIQWEGETKNLKFIRGSNLYNIVLIDDYSLYVEPGQEDNWIEIDQFDFPYSENDNELFNIGRTLQNMHNK
jgi:hypothetical protein